MAAKRSSRSLSVEVHNSSSDSDCEDAASENSDSDVLDTQPKKWSCPGLEVASLNSAAAVTAGESDAEPAAMTFGVGDLIGCSGLSTTEKRQWM